MRNASVLVTLSLPALLAACGLGSDEPTGQKTEPGVEVTPFTLRAPRLAVASPSELAVGDSLTVLGQDFVEPAHGRAYLEVRGTYFDSEGKHNDVDYRAQATVKNAGKLSWEMLPNIVFHARGDVLGKLIGNVTVVNEGKDGTVLASEPLPISITVKPSLIPRLMRPTGSSCGSLVSHTQEGLPMAMVVEAVGLRAATSSAPLTFHWAFLHSQWQVAFSYGTLDPSSVQKKGGVITIEDTVKSGRTSSVSDGGSKSYLLKVGSDLLGSSSLKELRTGTIPAEGNNLPVTVNVSAVDASGKSARLALKLTLHRKADLVYDGGMRLAERLPPVMVSDCIPGGDIGRDLSYQEGQSESRARSLSFNMNASAGINISPIPMAPYALGINFSVGFGVNVSEDVRSDQSKSLSLSGHILPGQYGTFYRQTSKVLRIATLVGYTECGQSYDLGEAILTDWLFTPDFATGPVCNPPSKLPPAGTFE